MGKSKCKGNSKRDSKVGLIISSASLSDNNDAITNFCKFNFKYFTYVDGITQDFNEWNQVELVGLLQKLKTYSENSLEYWKNTITGPNGSHYLEIYNGFPPEDKTKLPQEPRSVPSDAKWARFRLDLEKRLIGFIIPENFAKNANVNIEVPFDTNVFYVVYLDKEHNFYSNS